MKRYIFIILLVSMILPAGLFGARLFKVGFVDVEEVFNSYPGTSDIRQKLKDERDLVQAEIDKKKEETAVLEKNFQLASDKLTDDERQRRQAEIDYKKEILAEYIDDANKKLSALKDELSKPVYQKISIIIQRVSVEKGYSIVLRKGSDALLFADKDYDLTKDVITRIRKEVSIEDR